MEQTLQVRGVTAGPGWKVTAFLEVPGTDVRIPLTLVSGLEGFGASGYSFLRCMSGACNHLPANSSVS